MKMRFVFIACIFVLALNFALAATMSQASVCCEKTKTGAYCINTDSSNCDTSFKQSPTSCETTSYCKQGTCYDSTEGICMENTPQLLCNEQKGTWDARKSDQIPQCQLGCCLIADQAALVPLVRCTKLSQYYGVEVNFNKNIKDETNCFAAGKSQDKGACVYEQNFQKTCKFTTRGQCGAREGITNATNQSGITTTEKKFYKDYLCSEETLGTNCGKQTNTICYQGKVYWADSCGNRENIYSADKEKSWNKGRVLGDSQVCPANNGKDKNCGNCDYLLGTKCAEWEGGVTSAGSSPKFGDNYCKRTDCVDGDGNARKNGESWCVYDGKIGKGLDPVGSRHYKVMCVDGKLRAEPCADFRNQKCIQDSTTTGDGEFSSAQCRVNKWQDCLVQTSKSNCENSDVRDCMWMPSVTGLMIGEAQGTAKSGVGPIAQQSFNNPTAAAGSTSGGTTGGSVTGKAIAPITGNAFAGGEEKEVENTGNRPAGVCVPYFPPGFNFWKQSDAASICGQVNARCVIKYEKNIFGGQKKCIENCECEDASWASTANKICVAMGDCGGYINWVGKYTANYNYWFGDSKRTIPEYKSGVGQNIGQTGSGMILERSVSQGVAAAVGGNQTA